MDNMFLGRKTYSKTIGGAISLPHAGVISIPNPFLLPGSTTLTPVYFGNKKYELSDWLGNVRVVINDRKTPLNTGNVTVCYKPQMLSITDYYAYGSQIAERTYDPVKPAYRFGFNTQEKVFEITQDHYTAKFWEYDARLGRRWNVDPKPNATYSDYSVLYCNPIKNTDWLGDKPLDDYKIYASGKIERTKTNDKFDRFYYINNEGKETFIGQFDKIGPKNLLQIPLGKNDLFINYSKPNKTFVEGFTWAAILASAFEFKEETGLKIEINQLNFITGGHSKHGGQGQYADIRYISIYTTSNQNYKTSTGNKDFDQTRSQLLVDKFVKFGFVTTKNTISILTENALSTGPALKNTNFPSNTFINGKRQFEHQSHMHLQHNIYFLKNQ